jgi:hypothetical protein
MARLVILALFASLSSPALAAGGDMPFGFAIFGLLFFALPVAGVGFFLQAFMRLRTALLLLGVGALALVAYSLVTAGLSRTIYLAEPIALTLLLFSPAFAAGWFFGKRDATRRAQRQKHA